MIGILGGTFDPVHFGHIHLAEQALCRLSLDQVQFLPCANPVHREQPLASSAQRLQMLQLATSQRPKFRINTLELDRGGPSYMVDSLQQIHDQQRYDRVCLLIGVDAFNSIQSWKSPETILKLAHLVVCRRPGSTLDKNIYADHQTEQVAELKQQLAGCILALDIDENICSASEVRRLLATGQSVESCLPMAVIDYIKQHHLYEKFSE